MDTIKVELWINPQLEATFIDTFDLEIPILQGERKVMDNGQLYLKIEVSGERARMIKDFVQMMMRVNLTNIQKN